MLNLDKFESTSFLLLSILFFFVKFNIVYRIVFDSIMFSSQNFIYKIVTHFKIKFIDIQNKALNFSKQQLTV